MIAQTLKLILPVLIAFPTVMHAAESAPSVNGAAPIDWSRRLAESEMVRRDKTHFHGTPGAKWEYTSGLFAWSLMELSNELKDEKMRQHATELVTSFIDEDGGIATYKESDFNIDMILPGRVVIAVFEKTGDARLKKAAEHLREQLRKQPRTSDGGFWHKQRYPWQMWLDGLYMGSPFLASYAKTFGEPAAFDEVVKQIRLMDQHAYDPKSGLYFHAWDEKRAQSWANPQTGLSPCFWGRSIGWYAMAIVDCLENLPADHPGVPEVKSILTRLLDGAIRHQDPETGLWWQVVDQPKREGNYLEASASAMFVYTMAKAINGGHVERAKYFQAASKGYEALVKMRTRTDEAGRLHLTHVCEVAGLGFTSSKGRPRDGSFEYYISEPIVENDFKGVGPFILAGLEMQRLLSTKSESTPSKP